MNDLFWLQMRKPRRSGVAIASGGQDPVALRRLTVSGQNILDEFNQPYKMRGYNWGHGEQVVSTDGANAVLDGAQVIRIPFRWWSDTVGLIVDGRDDGQPDYVATSYWAYFDALIQQCVDNNLRFIIAMDSNCAQHGETSPDEIAYCELNGAGAHNIWNPQPQAAAQRDIFKIVWAAIVRRYKDTKGFALIEIMSEPNPQGVSTADVSAMYIEVMAYIDANAYDEGDIHIPYMVGPTDAYNIDGIATALISARNDIVYTGNLLSGSSTGVNLDAKLSNVAVFCSTNNVPYFCQQVGTTTVDDPTDHYQARVMAKLNYYGWGWTHWEFMSPAQNQFGVWYLVGSTRTLKPVRQAVMRQGFTGAIYPDMTFLQTNADAAAAAAGGNLFYIKNDLSNVFQLSGGTGAVTTANDPVGRFNPTTGSLNFAQATAGARPTYQLLGGNKVILMDGSNDFMDLSNGAYFASGDDFTLIVGVKLAALSSDSALIQTGNGTATPRYPHLQITNSTGVASMTLRGDDNVLRTTNSATVVGTNPAVITTTRSGASDRRLWIHSVQEAGTQTAAVGTIASITATRIGASTDGLRFSNGYFGLIYVGKAATVEQRGPIESLAGAIVGSAP